MLALVLLLIVVVIAGAGALGGVVAGAAAAGFLVMVAMDLGAGLLAYLQGRPVEGLAGDLLELRRP